MYLNKLLLKDFGKFNNREISLKNGVNLVYGGKESGKTTVRDFIVSILYGTGKTGAASGGEGEARKPESQKGFSGKAYIKDNGKSYFVERSFLKHSIKTSVMDVQSGRELRLKNKNSLHGTMLELDRNMYVNTMCIDEPQGAPGKEMAEELNTCIANLMTGGSVGLDRRLAVARLKEKRNSMDVRPVERQLEAVASELEQYEDVEEQLKDVREKLKKVDEEFAIETAKRKREARKLIETGKGVKYEENDELNENLESLAQNSVFLDADLLKDYKEEKKLTDKMWFILLTGAFVIAVITAMVYILPFENGVRQLFVICTTLFVIVTIVEGLYAKGVFDGEVQTPSEEEFKRIIYDLERKNETFEDVEIDMSFATEFMDRKMGLRDLEKTQLDNQQRKRELLEEQSVLARRRDGIEREIHAVNLAINTINDLSSRISGQFSSLLDNGMSDIVMKITDGRYQDVRFDDKQRIMVKADNAFMPFESVRPEDMRQIYVAIRIGIARALCRNRMPVILDEAFSGCDKFTIVNALECLRTIETDQIMLMTANPNLKELLDNSELEYNYVAL